MISVFIPFPALPAAFLNSVQPVLLGMDNTLASPVVLDNGSGLLKAGFAGSDLPDIVFQNYVGRPKHERIMAGAGDEDIFIGRKAEELRGILRLSHPMTHGVNLVSVVQLDKTGIQNILARMDS